LSKRYFFIVFGLRLATCEAQLYIIICYLKIEFFYNMFRIFIHLFALYTTHSKGEIC
jgi:hypothetical protein